MEIESSKENKDYGRGVAIVCYFWILGWIVALVLNSRKRTELGSFHLRQSLGLMLLVLLLFLVVRFRLVVIFVFIAGAVFGIVSAAGNQKSPLPGVGGLFENWFKSL